MPRQREDRGLVAQLHKMLGLEQKMRQYEVGEKFVRGVIEIGGPRAIDHAWVSPQNLPVLDREEYIEQAYFFRVWRERVADNLATQDILNWTYTPLAPPAVPTPGDPATA